VGFFGRDSDAEPTNVIVSVDMTTPTFTILLAINRPPAFLPFAIESVLAQTVEEFELFVVCDGAPVETIHCAREHAGRDPRVKVFDFPKGERLGEGHLHNALMAASGGYVAHIEDDDLWFPNHLEELEKLLQTADFGHLMHVFAKPDDSVEMLLSDLAIMRFRQRMLDEKFNRFGFSVCGYRLDAYRRLPDGWAPGPKGLCENFFAVMTLDLAREWRSPPLSWRANLEPTCR
jgi:glycosyltransferase involved in cell wall biosynthesis